MVLGASSVSEARGQKSRQPFRRAFTFAEMLIVLGVIALLMAILLPSISRVRDQANLAICQNNMKRIYDVFSLAATQSGKAGSPIDLPHADGWMKFVEGQNCMAYLVCPTDEKRDGKTVNDPTSSIISFLGNPPASVHFGAQESNSQLTCFREQAGFTLPETVSVDIVPNGGSGSVPAGTKVDSFFMTLDPVGHSTATVDGTISFGGKILGVICKAHTLDRSDPILGAPETSYPTGFGFRGVEEAETKLSVSPDGQTLIVHYLHAMHIGEHIRVLVAEGGMASYAMNKWAGESWGRADQILMVEYNKAVVNLETTNGPADDLAEWLAPRHRRKLNVLYNHGGFALMSAKELIQQTLDNQKADWRR